jgi:hypothetical protein
VRLKTSLAAFALLLAIGLQARAQTDFPWDKYRTRTLAEMVKGGVADAADSDTRTGNKTGILFSGDPLYSQVRVTYTGTTRKLAGARKTHLEEWGRSFGVESRIVALYDSEMLVTECGGEYWLPVQSQVLPHFEKELKKGDPVTLYTMYAGGRKIDGSWNWFFLVNEFQAYR